MKPSVDIHRFFASVDHDILFGILARKISDEPLLLLVQAIIGSFCAGPSLPRQRGLPIGNLTSQLFANVYLNELDQFLKQTLRIKRFVRYTDDFVVVSDDPILLRSLLPEVERFLAERLRLSLHPHKVMIRKARQGIDFLGYVILPHYRLLRAKTKRRMYRKLKQRIRAVKAGEGSESSDAQSLQSFLGVLSHADAYRLGQDLLNRCWYWLTE